jgi:hypothetical protein
MIGVPAVEFNTLVFVWGLIFWFAIAFGSRYIFARWSRTRDVFLALNDANRQLFVSLVNSTVHGLLIPLGVVLSFNSCDIWGDFLDASCTAVEPWFALSASYFVADNILLLIWPDEEQQTLYLVHHAIGLLPFAINCFWCSNMHFLVGAGILIEAANPCLNLCIIINFYGGEHTDYAAWAKYLCWLVWASLRCVWTLYLCHGMITISIPEFGISQCGVVPSYATGFIITFFCLCVLVVKLTPECIYFMRGEHKKAAAAKQKGA